MQFNKVYSIPNNDKVAFKKRKPVKKEHIKDIDFRSREQRQATSLDTFVEWYEELQTKLNHSYDDRTAGQLEILSAVLWHILPVYEYDRLRKINNKKQK